MVLQAWKLQFLPLQVKWKLENSLKRSLATSSLALAAISPLTCYSARWSRSGKRVHLWQPIFVTRIKSKHVSMYSISKPNTHLPVQRQPHISRHARNGTRFLQRLCLEICMPHTRLPSCFSVHVAGWNRITIAPGRRLNPFVCRTLASSVISVQQVWGRYGTWYSVPTDRKAVGTV